MNKTELGALKKKNNIEKEILELKSNQFVVLSNDPVYDKYNKRSYYVQHPECGHAYYVKRDASPINCPQCILNDRETKLLALAKKAQRVKKNGIRKCSKCGSEEKTKSKSTICMSCYQNNKKQNNSEAEIEKIKKWGYTVEDIDNEMRYGKRVYTVINPSCNHTFSVRYDNLRSMIEDRGYTTLPCGKCGKENNMKRTLAAYIQKYSRELDLSKQEDYFRKVRNLSEETYRNNLEVLNPGGILKRGMHDYHLDHKVPIAMCFRYGVTVENAASLENLELLPAKQNLSKNWLRFNPELLEKLIGNPINLSDVGVNAFCFFLENSFSVRLKIRDNVLYDNNFIPIVKIIDDIESIEEKSKDLLYVRVSELRDKRTIVLSRVAHKLGKSEKIYARKCKAREINAIDSKAFLDANHIQGYATSSVKLGLFHEDELIAVMTLGHPRFNKSHDWELVRYATVIGKTVVGGASKLLSFFLSKTKANSIISYADKRWSNGNLYRKLGFKQAPDALGSYYYINAEGAIIPRYKAMKHKLRNMLKNFDPTLTEVQNMENAGFTKVNDPGHYVFILDAANDI